MNRDLDNDLQALREMLPVPAERDFPPGRRRQREEHLMTSWPNTSPHSDRPKRRGLRLAIPLGLVAAAAGVALVTVPGDPGDDASPGRGVTGTREQPQAASPAVALLNRAAHVAASGPISKVRADQYVYIKSLNVYPAIREDRSVRSRIKLPEPQPRQVWLSVDGSRPGRLKEPGLPTGTRTKPGAPPAGVLEANLRPSLALPTYRYLESLPTDPDALLQQIYAENRGYGTKPGGPSRHERAFVTIGDTLREQLLPPKTSAALYKAAAKIPGVTFVKDAVDAADRHGVAVAFTRATGERTEWIFDRKTLVFLGERSVMVKNAGSLRAGQVTGTNAILTRAIVDHPGQTTAQSN